MAILPTAIETTDEAAGPTGSEIVTTFRFVDVIAARPRKRARSKG